MKDWTLSERKRQLAAQSGKTVTANMHKGADEALVAWAKAEGLAVRIDRPRKWSNPFHLGRHGDRAAIIAAYREHLDHSPGLKANRASCVARYSCAGAIPSLAMATCFARPSISSRPDYGLFPKHGRQYVDGDGDKSHHGKTGHDRFH